MASLAMIGPRQPCVAFSRHYGAHGAEGANIMAEANLTMIDFPLF